MGSAASLRWTRGPEAIERNRDEWDELREHARQGPETVSVGVGADRP